MSKKYVSFYKELTKLLSGAKYLVFVFALLTASFNSNAQNYMPRSYWTFDYPGIPLKDSMNLFNIDPNYYQSGYTINTNTTTGVGKYMTLNSASGYIKGGQVPTDSAFTIEFLFRPGYLFNTTKFFYRMDGSFTARMGYPYIQFSTTIKNTSGSYVTDDFRVELNQVGRKSYGYFMDNNWHHFVFKYNSRTGAKEIWIDGQLPAGFSTTTATGTIDNTASTNKDLMINTANAYEKTYGDFDEYATYSYGLPANMIYKHYTEFVAKKHYSFSYTSTPPPTPATVTAGIDINEFPPGHPNVSVSAIDQLKTFPLPRYKPGHTLLPNFNWADPMYMGGRFQSGVSEATSITNSVTIQTELAKNFNYMLSVTWASGDPWNDAWISLANQNPQLKLSLITYRAHLANNKIQSSSLANDHYLQNSSGQFLDVNGNVTSNKVWRPSAPSADYIADGQAARSAISSVLSSRLTRNIDFVNENGEVFPLISATAMAKDPVVTSAKNASGLDWENYLASRYKDNEVTAYRDQIMSLPILANAKFSDYRIDGHRDWQFRYEQTKNINTLINGKSYSTTDFYVRWPSNWRNWSGPWHGWQWIVESRYNEIAQGDNLYSPFVAAGWDIDPEKDVRPAQWLGLLKCLSMTGAEFFYTGYFNEQSSYMPPNPPPYDPKGYAWQVVMPPYAQAISSRYEDLMRNGYLMPGDVDNDYINPTFKAFNFKTGDLRKIVVIRKSNTAKKYAITGTVQPNSGMAGNAELESVATITLDGQTLKFKVRRQGSTYIYDNTNTTAPVFYQIDEWHDSKHPYYWTKDFNIEAELFDNTNASVYTKTTVPSGMAVGDYTQATTCVGFNAVTDVQYNFQPRGLTTQTYYLWVRARSKDGSTTGFTALLDGGSSQQLSCIKDTTWAWYRYNVSNAAVSYSNLSLANHVLKITSANTKLEIDKIALTTTSGAVYSSAPAPCSNAAVITPSGATTFCQGGSVILAANTGTSYVWSTGATTQNINVTTSGNYTVTVTTSGSGSAVSSPVTVTVNALPTASITAGGATTFCQGGSVTLTASAGSSYLWSPGNQTTQAIAVTTTGSYTVRVTNANGCSATSGAKSVTVNSLPTATISASGPLNINQGSTVTLTASAGSSYLWSPGNQTTQSITVGSAGSYTVRVTNSNGCSATSGASVVTINGTATATITAGGPTTFCQGGTVTLTANTGTSYLWSNSATTQTITVSSGGSYTVKVYNGVTSATSAPTVVTVNALPTATITAGGATTFCQGGSVTLTSSSGSSYLWSPGNQTTQSISVTATGNYTVRVTNSSGCTKISSAVSVTVTSCGTCPTPGGLFTTNVGANSAELNWSAVTGVDSLQIRLYEVVSGFTYITSPFSGNYVQITVGAQSATKYRWRIRSKCGNNAYTAWSDYDSFTTLAQRSDDASVNPDILIPVFQEKSEVLEAESNELRFGSDKTNNLTVYPNPTRGGAEVSYNSKYDSEIKLDIIDFTGKINLSKVLHVEEGNTLIPVDLGNYAKGIYMILITDNRKTVSAKIIVN